MAAANTSVAREYHAGLAALLGVHAALAAHKWYVAEESILETRQGFFEVYGGTHGAGVTRDLGREWDIITDMAIKIAGFTPPEPGTWLLLGNTLVGLVAVRRSITGQTWWPAPRSEPQY